MKKSERRDIGTCVERGFCFVSFFLRRKPTNPWERRSFGRTLGSEPVKLKVHVRVSEELIPRRCDTTRITNDISH